MDELSQASHRRSVMLTTRGRSGTVWTDRWVVSDGIAVAMSGLDPSSVGAGSELQGRLVGYEVGDRIQIQEKCEQWYRGEHLGSGQRGLFPANHFYRVEESAGDAFLSELRREMREWAEQMREHYEARRTGEFSKLRDILRHSLAWHRIYSSPLLVGAARDDVRAKLQVFLEETRRSIGQDLVVRNEQGGLATTADMSPLALLARYQELEKLQHSSSRSAPEKPPPPRGSRPPSVWKSTRVGVGAGQRSFETLPTATMGAEDEDSGASSTLDEVQVRVELKACALSGVGEACELRVALYDTSRKAVVSEEWVVEVGASGTLPPEGRLPRGLFDGLPGRFVRSDRSALVVRVVRVGGGSKELARRPFGCGVARLPVSSEELLSLPLYMPPTESAFGTAPEWVVSHHPPPASSLGSVALQVVFLPKKEDQEHDTDPKAEEEKSPIEDGPVVRAHSLLPTGASASMDRHELSVQVQSGEFGSSAKAVELSVQVHGNGSLRLCAGGAPVREYRGTVLGGTSSPVWNDGFVLTLDRDGDVVLSYSVRGVRSGRAGAELCGGVLRVRHESAGPEVVADGVHVLPAYKKDREPYAALAQVRDVSRLASRRTGGSLRLSTTLLSNTLSANPTLAALLHWREGPLGEALRRLTYVDRDELKRCLQPTVAALLRVFALRPADRPAAYDAWVHILGQFPDHAGALSLASPLPLQDALALLQCIRLHVRSTLTLKCVASIFHFIFSNLEKKIPTNPKELSNRQNLEKASSEIFLEDEITLISEELNAFAQGIVELLEDTTPTALAAQRLALRSFREWAWRLPAERVAAVFGAAPCRGPLAADTAAMLKAVVSQWSPASAPLCAALASALPRLPPSDAVAGLAQLADCLTSEPTLGHHALVSAEVRSAVSSALHWPCDDLARPLCTVAILSCMAALPAADCEAHWTAHPALRAEWLAWVALHALPRRWAALYAWQRTQLDRLWPALERAGGGEELLDVLARFLAEPAAEEVRIKTGTVHPEEDDEEPGNPPNKDLEAEAMLKRLWEAAPVSSWPRCVASFLRLSLAERPAAADSGLRLLMDALDACLAGGGVGGLLRPCIDVVEWALQSTGASGALDRSVLPRLDAGGERYAPCAALLRCLRNLYADLRDLPPGREFDDERADALLRLLRLLRCANTQEKFIDCLFSLLELLRSSDAPIEAACVWMEFMPYISWFQEDPSEEEWTMEAWKDLEWVDSDGFVDALEATYKKRRPRSTSLFQAVDESKNVLLTALGPYPTQTVEARKKQMMEEMISCWEAGKYWERAIDLLEDQRRYYLEQRLDYERLADVLERQARLYRTIMTADRFFPEYFFVGHYGAGFPPPWRNVAQVVRAAELERTLDFQQKVLRRWPGASLLRTTEPPDDALRNGPGMHLQVFQVKPISPAEPRRTDVPLPVQRYWAHNGVRTFAYARPELRKREKSDNDFACLWIRRSVYTTEHAFPSVHRAARIVQVDVTESPPLANAVASVRDKSAEIELLHAKFAAGAAASPQQLTMVLKGVIDAAVNGGTKLYADAFLDEAYLRNAPDDAPLVLALRTALRDQLGVLEKALRLHASICDSNMLDLHRSLESSFLTLKNSDTMNV